MHRIHTPLTQLQRPHNHPTSMSPPPHLCSTSSQHLLFISRYPRSTTNILATYNWSLLSVHLALSLEYNFLVLSINLMPAPLSLSCLFMLLPHLLTLSTHYLHPTLSLPAQYLPFSQIFPTIDSLPASQLIPQTLRLDCFFWAFPFLFLVSSLHFFVWFRAAD